MRFSLKIICTNKLWHSSPWTIQFSQVVLVFPQLPISWDLYILKWVSMGNADAHKGMMPSISLIHNELFRNSLKIFSGPWSGTWVLLSPRTSGICYQLCEGLGQRKAEGSSFFLCNTRSESIWNKKKIDRSTFVCWQKHAPRYKLQETTLHVFYWWKWEHLGT